MIWGGEKMRETREKIKVLRIAWNGKKIYQTPIGASIICTQLIWLTRYLDEMVLDHMKETLWMRERSSLARPEISIIVLIIWY